jgi:hypothetical protein
VQLSLLTNLKPRTLSRIDHDKQSSRQRGREKKENSVPRAIAGAYGILRFKGLDRTEPDKPATPCSFPGDLKRSMKNPPINAQQNTMTPPAMPVATKPKSS